MRGTVAVRIGTGTAYACVTTVGRTARLRLSADECDRFDLFAGRQVRLGLDGRASESVLVTTVRRDPPFVWVDVEFTATARRDRVVRHPAIARTAG
jgi:hypothetical protein